MLLPLQLDLVVYTEIGLLFSTTGKYRTQLYDDTQNDYLPASPGIGMHVEVLDPEKKVILSKFYASEGRFTFTSHTPGEHHICLPTHSTKWSLFAGGRLVILFLMFVFFFYIIQKIIYLLNSIFLQRVHLEILVGEHANDYAQIAAKDKVTELQLRMRQLLDQVDQITKEQAYQRVCFSHDR